MSGSRRKSGQVRVDHLVVVVAGWGPVVVLAEEAFGEDLDAEHGLEGADDYLLLLLQAEPLVDVDVAVVLVVRLNCEIPDLR